MGYSYYDSPEGEDCFHKLLYTTKLGAFAGIVTSSFDVLMYSHPKGYVNTLSRFGYFTFPFVGMAAAFTATTCLATNYRHKDDKLNYFLGGLSSGAVYGAWRRSLMAGFAACAVFSGAALLKKHAVENGWELFPEVKHHTIATLRSNKHDWTLMKDPAKSS